MTRLRKIAVVTTFSKSGFEQYAERMLETWVKNWPATVDLFVYPDEPVALPRRANVRGIYDPIPEKEVFIRRYQGRSKFRGRTEAGYNYRFDAVKFCHKPFALWHCMHTYLLSGDHPYSGLIWLDADTVTHAPVDDAAVARMAPPEFDIQFLGRCYKYTECGYIYFNLESRGGPKLLDDWVGLYTSCEFARQTEWHDSFLFDIARKRLGDTVRGNDLTGHLPRRKGAGHPLINSFLGQYLDHLKGDARKITKQPRKGDLFIDHESEYWRMHSHAKARTKPAS